MNIIDMENFKNSSQNLLRITLKRIGSDEFEVYDCNWHGITDHKPNFLAIGFRDDTDYPMKMIRLDLIEEIDIKVNDDNSKSNS